MAKVKVTIQSASIPSLEVVPYWDGKLTSAKEREQVYLRTAVTSDMVLTKSDYVAIKEAPACEVITLTIETWCDDAWQTEYVGTFTHFNCRFDHDTCTVTFKPDVTDEYKCFLKNWDDEEIVHGAGTVVITRTFQGVYKALIGCSQCCRPNNDLSPCDQSNILGPPARGCVQSTVVTQMPSTAQFCPGQFKVETCYHRIEGIGTTTTPPPYGSGWELLTGTTWWRCPSFDEARIGPLKYGRRFNDILIYLVSGLGCGLTVRSHLFNINATHAAAPTNIAYTFAAANLRHMTVHQKSDVKKPDASDPAFPSVWKMKLKQLLADLKVMFNADWVIEGTDFIIEHTSYFDKNGPLDVTDEKIKLIVDHDDSDGPEVERYEWSDDVVFGTLFEGLPISYTCGSGTREYKVQLFTTDLVSVGESRNAEDVLDENFCLVANTFVANEYAIISGNEPLGWTALHNNMHRHGRAFASGKMNNVNTTFLTTRANRTLEPFELKLCCNEQPPYNERINTALGWAQIQEVTRDLNTDRVTFKTNL